MPPRYALLGYALLALLTVWAGTSVASDSANDADACHETLCLNASHLEYSPNHLVLHQFDIVDTTKGRTQVKGDLAEGTGRDSKNSTWVLTGNVQVFMPQGHLSAERATMQIVNNRIRTMTAQGSAQGSPAEFESSGDTSGLGLPGSAKSGVAAAIEHAHGHADEIIYSLDHNELQLNGNSWLSNGCNEISSQHIAYDIASQKVHAETNPGDKAGVHIIARRCAAETDKP